MSMKISIILLAALLILAFTWHFKSRSGPSRAETSLASSSAGPCQADSYVQKLSSDMPEAGQAAIKLTELAKESGECREEVINALIEALNKADLQNDDSAFRLWAKGSGVLGELKAVEALDLLIAHLNLSDGWFSASMVHEPVVGAIEKMGEVAVPKLAVALKHNRDKGIRLAAALCLATIGGSEALAALNSALTSEKEECVRRLISLLLPSPDESANSKRRLTAKDGELLRQRILAYRCSN
jgi:HEAT repeat protein